MLGRLTGLDVEPPELFVPLGSSAIFPKKAPDTRVPASTITVDGKVTHDAADETYQARET